MKQLTPVDPEYPLGLNELKNPPKQLWVKGDLPPFDAPIAAVVGTRQASESSKRLAYELAKSLADQGVWVISGLARGIDTAAHQGAISKTIAILGSGLDHIYPAENKELAKSISLISEYSNETRPHRSHFPQRNRIVAGLCQALIVIEAPEKSGALITAKQAHTLNKKCFVIPGPMDKEHFKGSNRLIKEGKGEICLNLEEIFSFFKKDAPVITKSFTHSKSAHPEELKIISLLEREDLSFDQLILLTGYQASRLNVHLMGLVLNRIIREYAGRVYGKIINHR